MSLIFVANQAFNTEESKRYNTNPGHVNDSLNEKGSFIVISSYFLIMVLTQILDFKDIKSQFLTSVNDYQQPSFRSDLALNFKKQSETASPTFNDSQYIKSTSQQENLSPNLQGKLHNELNKAKSQILEMEQVISVKNEIIEKLDSRNAQERDTLEGKWIIILYCFSSEKFIEFIDELKIQLQQERSTNNQLMEAFEDKMQNDSMIETNQEKVNQFEDVIKQKDSLIHQVSQKNDILEAQIKDYSREK